MMHPAAGNQRFIGHSIDHIKDQLSHPSPEVSDAIGAGLGSTDPSLIEKKRIELIDLLNEISQNSKNEADREDNHYVSRFDGVGLFQSALDKVFKTFPDLQGYGDWNPLWIITEIEVFAYRVKSFMSRVHTDESGKNQAAWAAITSELVRLKAVDDRAAYPAGTPETTQIPDSCVVALLADWGGDNDAAKHIAEIVRVQKPDIAIHLGDIYYGGRKANASTS